MERLIDFIQNVDPFWMHVLLFSGAYIENMIPPAPGDTVVVFGAYLVGTGTLTFELVFFATTLGSLAGFMTVYGVGRILGIKLVETKKWRFFSSVEFIRVEAWFEKYGYAVIAANRFLSGARAIVSLFAGVMHLNIKKVFVLALLSCVVWNVILIYAGSKVGENWGRIVGYIREYNIVVFSILVIVLSVVGIRWYRLRNRK